MSSNIDNYRGDKRYECVRCHKKKKPHFGTVVNCNSHAYPQFPQRSFLCYRCIDALQREDVTKKIAMFRPTQDEIRIIKSAPSELEILTQLLRETAKNPGWYEIRDLSSAFSERVGYKVHPKSVSYLLNKLGFKSRARFTRKKRTCVFVDLSKVE